MDLKSWLQSKAYLTEGIRAVSTHMGEGFIIIGMLTEAQESALLKTAHRPPPQTTVLKYLVLKFYYRLSIRRQLGYTIFGSRAMRSWIASRAFTLLEIPTPKPIALIESKRFGAITDRALFVTEVAKGTALSEFLEFHNQDLEVMKKIALAARTIFKNLAKHRIYHSDTNTKNFIVHPDHSLSIIDLDAVQFFVPQKKWPRKRSSDERKFAKLWKQYPHLTEIFSQTFEH